jgi:hypothetical protein
VSWSSILSGILAVIAFIRELLEFKRDADAREAGRDDLAADINKETVDALDRMAQVDPNPSDDAVANSMRTGQF